MVHRDFAGKLLSFADGAPAVIDVSPCWRPVGYPTAQIAVAAVIWYGGDTGPARHAAHVPELDQLLARALVFRLAIDGLHLRPPAPGNSWDTEQAQRDLRRTEPLIDLSLLGAGAHLHLPQLRAALARHVAAPTVGARSHDDDVNAA